MADLKFTAYTANGEPCGSGDIFLPRELDWMPIKLKGEWFRWVANGPTSAKYVLLSSQGEQLLLIDVTLSALDYRSFKEKTDGNSDKIEDLIKEGGYSRVPRNQ